MMDHQVQGGAEKRGGLVGGIVSLGVDQDHVKAHRALGEGLRRDGGFNGPRDGLGRPVGRAPAIDLDPAHNEARGPGVVNVRRPRDALQDDAGKPRALRTTAPVDAGRDQRGDASRGQQLGDQGTFQRLVSLG